MKDKTGRIKTHRAAKKLIGDLRDNQPATVARVVRDGLLNSASKEEALMNRDLRQVAASAKLSVLLDQLETALPVLPGARRRCGRPTGRNSTGD
jgi:hypothetical protein